MMGVPKETDLESWRVTDAGVIFLIEECIEEGYIDVVLINGGMLEASKEDEVDSQLDTGVFNLFDGVNTPLVFALLEILELAAVDTFMFVIS